MPRGTATRAPVGAIVAAVVASAVLGWPGAVPVHAQAVTEFPLPNAGSQSLRITSGPDGALGFTEFAGNRIGRITTAGAITEFPLPNAGSSPDGITTGPDGALWFAEVAGNRLGRITTAGAITEFPLPNAGSNPVAVVTGPDGALWVSESGGNRIGRMTTSGAVTEFPLPQPNSGPDTNVVGPDGAIWFVERTGARIGRITTAGAISEFAIPWPNSTPTWITNGPDGALWFSDSTAGRIGRITPAGAITSTVLGPGAAPFGITTGPDGALWYADRNGNTIGRLTTGGTVTQFGIPTANSQPVGINTGSDSALWFTEQQGNRIGRLVPATLPTPTTTPTALPSTTPLPLPTTVPPILIPSTASGPDPASIRGAVDAFRAALGPNNGTGGSQPSGRREINWDGTPDAFAAPNNLPADFFNTQVPRGVVLRTPGSGLQVSASPESGVPVRFGNLHPTYRPLFETFSSPRLFTALGSRRVDVSFFLPGTTTPAAVSGFGAVFINVDDPNTTGIEYFDTSGASLGEVLALPGELAFAAGQLGGANPRIARVRLTSGNTALGPLDASPAIDVVVMDDFIYGEPQAAAPTAPTAVPPAVVPTASPTPVIVPLSPRPAAPTGASAACASGGTASATGGVNGTFRCGSYTFSLTATGPAGTQVGGAPAVFVQAVTSPLGGTAVTDAFTCTQRVPVGLTVTCTGSSANYPARGGLVTIRFPLAAGGTADVTGLIAGSSSGSATIVAPLLPPPLPPLPPPPLPPPLVPVFMPAPPPPVGAAAPPEVPVIPEADSVTLLGGGLAILALLAALRRARRLRAS